MWAMPRLCKLCPGICPTTKEKAQLRKKLEKNEYRCRIGLWFIGNSLIPLANERRYAVQHIRLGTFRLLVMLYVSHTQFLTFSVKLTECIKINLQVYNITKTLTLCSNG